jgi:segregation and condensation protein A
MLYQKQQIEENVWSNPDKSLYNDEGTEGELVVSLVDLVRVFQQVLERKKEVARIELQHETFTVAQMIAQLRGQILASDTNTVNLVQFFEACPSRHAMIVAFLAVLEMVKLQAIALTQEKQFGEIQIKKAKAFDIAFDDSGAMSSARLQPAVHLARHSPPLRAKTRHSPLSLRPLRYLCGIPNTSFHCELITVNC